MKKILLMFVISSFLIIPMPASANPATDAGVAMVAGGIDAFFSMAGNAIMGGNSTAAFSSLSVFYDPITNPVVVESLRNTSVFGLTIYISYVLLAMAYLVLQSRTPGVIRTAEYITNNGKPYNLVKFVKKCSTMIVLYVFILIIMYAILQIAQIFTNIMDTSSISAIQASAQSGFMTFIYSLFWLVLSILITLRNLIITFIYCFLVILIMLWGFDIFQKPIEVIGIYFILLAFMQPVMVGVAAIGIRTIEFTKGMQYDMPGISLTNSVTLALLIILIAIGVMFVIGPIYFHKQFYSLRK